MSFINIKNLFLFKHVLCHIFIMFLRLKEKFHSHVLIIIINNDAMYYVL